MLMDKSHGWSPLRRLLWLHIITGGGIGWATVSGSSPLALVNSIAHSIHSLTQYGKCVQNGTPTPSDPVNVVCNNGEIKISPNELDASSANVTLGYYIEKTTGQVRLAQGNSNFMCEAYMPVVAGESYIAYGRKKNGGELAHYCRIAWYKSDKSWLSGGNYTENVLTVNTAPANAAYARFSCNPSGVTSVEVTQELVDSYYWVFQKGSEEPSTVHAYGEIYVDGTPETLTVSGINLLNEATNTKKAYISSNGTITTNNADDAQYTDLIPVVAGETYTWSLINQRSNLAGTNRWHGYNAAGTWVRQIAYSGVGARGTAFELTATIPNDVVQVRLSYGISDENVMFEKSNTASEFQPYSAPQTASVVDLLAVGSAADTQEIVGGDVDRITTKFRVTSDMNWALATGTGFKQFYTTDTQGVLKNSVSCMSNIAPYGCTASNRASYQHGCYTGGTGNLCFQMIGEAEINTVDDWKDFLRSNGVYVVAAKATATTEQTTPHVLHTSAGTNAVTVEANVSGIELECKYKGRAA